MPAKPAVGTPSWGGPLNDFLDTKLDADGLDVEVGQLIGVPGTATADAIAVGLAAKAAKAANLSDLASASSARNNLGLGTAATFSSGSFDASGAAAAAQAAAIAASDPAGAAAAAQSAAIAACIPTTAKAAVNGVASLNGSGLLVQNVSAANILGGVLQPGSQVFSLSDPQFGVVGDGVADDSAAVQSWIDAVIASRAFVYVPVGYAPAGDYLQNTAATASGCSDAKFTLAGGGMGATRFICSATNTVGGLLFDATVGVKDARVTFRDFTIMTKAVGAGVGLSFVMDPTGATHSRSVTMFNVEVCGYAKATDCFDIFMDLTGNYHPYLENVTLTGPWGPGISGGTTDASAQYVATACLVMDGSYEYHINGCHIWAAHTLIRDVGTTGEGGRIMNTQLVAGRVGIQRSRTGREPHFQIENCHINCRDTALDIDGAKIIFIRGNHFYNTDDTNEFTGTARDVYLKNSEMAIISNNFFHFDGATDRIHVHVDSTTYGQKITIESNIFNAIATNAVLLGTAADNVVLLGNQYTGTYTKRVVDNSGKAVRFDMVVGVWRSTNSNVGAGAAPIHEFMRDSVSPAANDLLARFKFLGKDSTDAETEYAAQQIKLLSPTNTSESASIQFYTMVAGTLVEAFTIQPPADTETGMKVIRNHGGTYTIQTVSEGATDSGGSGYRYLRVPN